jgi:acyl-CoA synthetase (AMP-forming)/AMP-acid ligase II
MTRVLTPEERSRFEPARKSAAEQGWFVTDQYIGGGGGADVLLALRSGDMAAFTAATPLPSTVIGANTITGATTDPARLIQFLAERLVSRRDVLAALKIPSAPEARIRKENPKLKLGITLSRLAELIAVPAALPPSALAEIRIDPTDPAIFQLSGGTTGIPKLDSKNAQRLRL